MIHHKKCLLMITALLLSTLSTIRADDLNTLIKKIFEIGHVMTERYPKDDSIKGQIQQIEYWIKTKPEEVYDVLQVLKKIKDIPNTDLKILEDHWDYIITKIYSRKGKTRVLPPGWRDRQDDLDLTVLTELTVEWSPEQIAAFEHQPRHAAAGDEGPADVGVTYEDPLADADEDTTEASPGAAAGAMHTRIVLRHSFDYEII